MQLWLPTREDGSGHLPTGRDKHQAVEMAVAKLIREKVEPTAEVIEKQVVMDEFFILLRDRDRLNGIVTEAWKERPWTPFQQTGQMRDGHPVDELEENETYWANNHYLVHRAEYLYADDHPRAGKVGMVHLSMRTRENDARHDWREMQRVKTELCGEDWEAIELYPATERTVDTANQFHLWCYPPGTTMHEAVSTIGFTHGFTDAKEIAAQATRGRVGGAVQR